MKMSYTASSTTLRSLPHASKNWWIVATLLGSLLLGGSEVTMFGRKPVIAPFEILLLAVLVLLLYRAALGSFNFDLGDKQILNLSLAFMGCQLVSFLFNLLDVPRGFLALKVFACGYLSYVLCISVLQNSNAVERILLGLILWGSVLGILLIYYYITDWALVIAEQAGNETKDEIGLAIGRSNYVAALLVPILPVAIATIFTRRGLIRFGAGVSAGLILVGILITMSKGALLSLVVGPLVAGPLLWKAGVRLRHVAVVLGTVVGLLLIIFMLEPDLLSVTYEMFSSRLDTPDFARLDLWKVGWNTFTAHPLLGVGPNAIYLFNRQFAIEDLYTHNFILNALSEFGLIGAVPFFLLLGALLRRGYRLCLSTLDKPELKPIALGLFVGFLSTLAHGLVEPTFPGQQYAVIFWMLMALIHLYQRVVEQSTKPLGVEQISLGTSVSHKFRSSPVRA